MGKHKQRKMIRPTKVVTAVAPSACYEKHPGQVAPCFVCGGPACVSCGTMAGSFGYLRADTEYAYCFGCEHAPVPEKQAALRRLGLPDRHIDFWFHFIWGVPLPPKPEDIDYSALLMRKDLW
jgi:hypothetical protein